MRIASPGYRIIGFSALISVVSMIIDERTAQTLVITFALITSVLIQRACRRAGDEFRNAFGLFGVAGFLLVSGIIVRGIHGELIGATQPLPSPADILHYPAYTLYLVTMHRTYRARWAARDRRAWVDTVSLIAAIFIVVWLLYLGDVMQNEALTSTQRLMLATYHLIVLALAAVFLRIAATPGYRPVSYYLLGLAAAGFFVADGMATASYAHPVSDVAGVALAPLTFGLALAGVRHPSAPELLVPKPQREQTVGLFRVATTCVTILAPALVVLFSNQLTLSDEFALGTASVILAAGVSYRLLLLLTDQQHAIDMEQRYANEIARLAGGSGVEILESLESAIDRVVGHPVAVLLPESMAPEAECLPIPKHLMHNDDSMVLALSTHITTGERRMASSLLRDAALVASASEEEERKRTRAIAEREREATRRSEKRFRALVQNASDIFIVLDLDGNATYASDAVSRVLGRDPESLLGKQLNDIVHENDRDPAARHFMAVADGATDLGSHEFRAYTADGEVRLFEAIMTNMADVPEVNGIVVNGTDVTAKRSLERDLKDAETIDPLTLQLNRKAFISEVETAIRRASISGVAVSIAIIDLNDFKTINDALGPVLADQALVEAANRIRRSVRLGDVVARLSGDEFGVLMPDGYSSLEAVAAIERVLDELRRPFELDRHPLALEATAGLAIDIAGKVTSSILLREADTALGTAKRSAAGRAVMFEEEMASAVSERLDLRSGFERALQNEEMRLVYQPIVDMKTNRIVSLEALARWSHPHRGEVSPSIFIPIAEESNTITQLGEWALRTACRQVNEWTRRGLSEFTVSVNMSGLTLIEDDVISRVRSILEETEVDPSRIVVEITETVLIDDTEFIADRIRSLRRLGVSLAIDDFGTGYSSLSYLQRYEFDYLKIDRAFVRPLEDPTNEREREIVSAIISLANGLGAVTVAEGIEGESEQRVLCALDCDRAQGFLYHRPKEVTEIFEILCEDLALDVAA